MNDWRFDSEFSLEEFIWSHLPALLQLEPLARQYAIAGQYCDILAKTSDRQLVILELKNGEDRYICPQLTRYFEFIHREKPFSDFVDYTKPVRLVAFSPVFHEHNFIDQKYSRLTLEFWQFRLYADGEDKYFEWHLVDSEESFTLPIPKLFERSLQPIPHQADAIAPPQKVTRPPKSFRTLLEGLSPDQQAYLLSLREKLLSFDDRIIEIGLTKRTQYGLRKGKKEIFKGNICAEFMPCKVFSTPKLYLSLPYPQWIGRGSRQIGKMIEKGNYRTGYAMTRVPLTPKEWERAWQGDQVIGVIAGNRTLNHPNPAPSFTFTLERYCELCEHLLGDRPQLESSEAFIELALQQWQSNLNDTGATDVH